MGIIAWMILGGLAGWIASVLTGVQKGFLGSIVVGIFGALLGGFLANAFGEAGITGLNGYSLLVATVGSVATLVLTQRVLQ